MAPTLLVPGSLRAEGALPTDVPVDFIRRWLTTRMPEFGGKAAGYADRVLIVRAETGSGKSTVLPVSVFRILRSERTPARQRYSGAGVICTQPRVLTAIALANDVSAERMIDGKRVRLNPDMVLGETVGYQTGDVSDKPPSGLLFATAGVLAAQLRGQEDDEIMGRYRFILVDEAHERSLDGDVLLMMLKNFFERNLGNPRLPFLLLTSATFDTARYADYFGVGPANVVEVVGRSYGITTHWPETGTNDYPAAAAAAVVSIHEAGAADAPERADVLVFMPGEAELKAVAKALAKANEKYAPPVRPGAQGVPSDADADDDDDDEPADERAGPLLGALQARAASDAAAKPKLNKPKLTPPFLVLTINRSVVLTQAGDFTLVFERAERLPDVNGRRPSRRVILSTVVAETGLTIDTLRYVIDAGWSRSSEAYPPWGITGLTTRPAAQSRVKQRKGRAGRLFPGDFYPLYTERVHDALDAQQLPDVFTTGVGGVYLALVGEQQRQKLRTGRPPEFRVEDMALLDPLPTEVFLAANATAVALGFVSPRATLPGRWPPPGPADGPPPDFGAAPPAPLALARGYGLTTLGHLASKFTRTPPEGVRALLAGYVWGAAASDLATAVAMFGAAPGDLLFKRGRGKASPGGLPLGAEALRAALPPYLAAAAHGGGAEGARRAAAPALAALPPTQGEAFYYRAKLLLADDYAEAALAFDAFAARADAARGDAAAVAAWCREVGLGYAAMLELSARRDLILNEVVLAGLNPYRGRRLAALPADDFVAGLAAFKRCLYDGLRCRLLARDDGVNYTSRQGLRVRVPPLLSDAAAARLRALQGADPTSSAQSPALSDAARPRWAVADAFRLAPVAPRKGEPAPPLLYGVEAGLVCYLDGYVDPDPDFDACV